MKIRDRMLLAATAGTIGNLAAFALDLTSKKLKLNDGTWAERGKRLVVSNKYKDTKSANFSGFLVQEAISVIGAIPLVYAHSVSGKDKAVVKGAMYGCLTWLSLYGLGQRVIGSFRSTPTASITNLFNNITYGVATAVAITKLGDDSLFRGKAVYENTGKDKQSHRNDLMDDVDADWAESNMISDEDLIH